MFYQVCKILLPQLFKKKEKGNKILIKTSLVIEDQSGFSELLALKNKIHLANVTFVVGNVFCLQEIVALKNW